MNHLVRQLMFGGGDTLVTCTITSDKTEFTNKLPFEIQIEFSAPRTGFIVGDINISNALLLGFAGSGTSYTVNVEPDASGDIEISVDENVTVEGNSASNVVTVIDNI